MPPSKIGEDVGGVRIRHRYHVGDHGPAHAHVEVGGATTRVGPKGYPLEGEPDLTPAQRRAVEHNRKPLRKTLNRIGRLLKGGSLGLLLFAVQCTDTAEQVEENGVDPDTQMIWDMMGWHPKQPYHRETNPIGIPQA